MPGQSLATFFGQKTLDRSGQYFLPPISGKNFLEVGLEEVMDEFTSFWLENCEQKNSRDQLLVTLNLDIAMVSGNFCIDDAPLELLLKFREFDPCRVAVVSSAGCHVFLEQFVSFEH